MKEIIEVTAAIIKNDNNEFLICQRPEGKNCEFLWEFPGGKQEPDETPEQCIIREIKEELSIDIEVKKKYDDITRAYKESREHKPLLTDKIVHITFFECEIKNGILKAKEHHDIKWISAYKLCDYKFCPADSEIIKRLHAEKTL